MKCFKFFLALVIFYKLLSVTKSLPDALQSTCLDLAEAADFVVATIETQEAFRSDHSWDYLFDYVESCLFFWSHFTIHFKSENVYSFHLVCPAIIVRVYPSFQDFSRINY